MKRFYLAVVNTILLLFVLSVNAQTVNFSKQRGIHTSTFSLVLTSDLSGANIKYTTNGTPPSASVGTTYTSAITISTTTVISAIAVKGATTSSVFTSSYIFPNKVILQPANISGWPNNSYDLGNGGSAVHDYEMDPAIVNNSAYSGQMINALTAIPTMSIVMDKNQFWQVYDDPSGDIENPASVELIYPNAPSQNEQVNCGLESHSHLRLKRSLKLDFHSPEFISKIFKNAPLNSGSATDDFSGTKIVLRGGNNDCWARNWNPAGTTYTRDEWYRASQLAVDGYGSHGTFVHLYVNGLYWGLYNPIERPDEGFASEYLGGSSADWFSVNHDGVRTGDATRYNYLINTLVNKDMTVVANYNEFKQYVDVSAFSDYMIISWMPGMDDWPNNNFYGANRNTPPGPLVYFGWDCEWSWTNLHSSNNGAWVSPYFGNNGSYTLPIPKIWKAGKANPDFMMEFADRVYKNCFNGGPMSDDVSRARWKTINDFVSLAIIAESARWGDAVDPNNPRTKNGDWQPEVNRIDGLMNGNVTRFINALRAEGYYPNLNPPNFNQESGTVLSSFQLTMTNPNGSGTIYYTTNGTDPRQSGGNLSPDAQSYSGSIAINGTKTIRARIKNGSSWSPLHVGNYAVYGLKINEFMANNTNGITNEHGNYEDWIEIFNNSSEPINIGGLYVTDLLSQPKKWQVPTSNPAATTIPPYGFILLWADQQTTFGILHTNFKLTNTGEQIGISVATGSSTTFLDSYIFGNQAANISTGRLPDGTGAFQTFTQPTPGNSNELTIHGLYINEFLASNQTDLPDEFAQQDDWFEIYNDNNTAVDIAGLYVTDNLTDPTNWQIPLNAPNTTTIPAKGFLLLWADGEPAQGPRHVNFKLDNSGEQIGLVQSNGRSFKFIDSLTFGTQTANISYGRVPDGGNNFIAFTSTTPGSTNTPNASYDCNGVLNGTAFFDDCGICSGGNTGHVANSNKDNCGVCFGNGSSCGGGGCTLTISSLTLVKTGTAGDIGELQNGQVINLAVTPDINVRANPCQSDVKSVKFILNGSTYKTESTPPFALAGDNNGSYLKWNVSPGSYTLTATPYSASGGSGTAGTSKTVSFTVVNQQGGGTYDCNGVLNGTAAIDDCGVCAGGNTGKVPNANKDCNGVCYGTAIPDACGVCGGDGSSCASSCVHNEVISFTLMKVGTADEIGPLTNGMVINKSTTGSFSIRANVCDSPVGSVKFILNGSSIKTESTPPYAINGDSPVGNYIAWNPNPGAFTLEGKPYSGSGGSGTAGVSEIISFTVVNSAAKMEEPHSGSRLNFNIYPNPANGEFTIEAYHEEKADLTIRILNSLGQVISKTTEKDLSGSLTKQFDNRLIPGVYYIELTWGKLVERTKVSVQ